MELCEDVQKSISSNRREFQLAAANAGYYQSEVMTELQRLEGLGVVARVDGKVGAEILIEFQTFQQRLSDWQRQNNYSNILNNQLDLPAPGLFLVLPADLDTWDDSDPKTQTFRLYFVCDFAQDEELQPYLPSHKHLSNHPGYDLIRPEEFFQKYGSYALSILTMVKQGYSNFSHNVPPLDTFDILWSCDPTTDELSKNNIEALVNKAIAYIHKLSPKSTSKILDRRQIAGIKQFLQVPYGDDGVGELCRTTNRLLNIHWGCHEHSQQWIDPEALEILKDFVRDHGGLINMREAMIKIELVSPSMAMHFCTLLKDMGHTFDISIKLSWELASRQELKDLFLDIIPGCIMHLEIDGVTLDTHPQGQIEYGVDLFERLLAQHDVLRSVTLLNYPRQQEQTVYMEARGESAYQLNMQQPEMRPDKYWWKDVRDDLRQFEEVIVDMEQQSYFEAAERLKRALSEQGLKTVSSVGFHYSGFNSWRGVFDLDRVAFRELQLFDSVLSGGPRSFIAAGSLSQLTVDFVALDFDMELARIVQCNPMLQELNVSVLERSALLRTEEIVRMLQDHQHPLCLTLLERGANSQGRIVAQVMIQSSRCNSPEDNIQSLVDNHSQTQVSVTSMSIEFLQWASDQISVRLSDSSASLLDIATRHSPSVLTSLALDISGLSQKGLSSIENILQRSCLERLNVNCSRFNSSLTGSVLRVLRSVQWSTIKFLELIGSDIDSWMYMLAKSLDESNVNDSECAHLYLLNLEIRAIGPEVQQLSHTSTLFIHREMCSNLVVEVRIENVEIPDECDLRLLDVQVAA
ncbi:hypothetical protein BG000_004000 [Podila horticola]|nr:hypothetical protein BG000_004000 [Podila horticola]